MHYTFVKLYIMRYILIFAINLIFTGYALSQNTITFEVKEESGESLIGASVVIEGTTQGAIANTEGKAKLESLEYLPSATGLDRWL